MTLHSPRSRRLARALAVATIGLTALTGVTAGANAASTAPAADPTDSSRLDSFAACLAAEKTGDIVILLDESGSLTQTDPQHARVAAAKQLTDQWAELPEAGITIDTRLAGFADDVAWVGGWTPLTAKSLPSVTNEVEGFTSRNRGGKTDYWRALDAADRELARRRAQTGHRCQAIVWFSDGKLDVAPTVAGQDDSIQPYLDRANVDDATATQMAAKDLCRPGGRADQLRGRGVALFGIGLAPSGSAKGDFDLMRGIVTGSDGCGSRTTPTPGFFQTADDIDTLLRAFFRLGTPTGSAAPDSDKNVCSPTSCPISAQHSIALDPAITAVNIFVTHPSTASLRLTPPTGAALALTPEGSTAAAKPQAAGGATITSVRRSPTAATIRMTWRGSSAKPGVWRLAVVDPQPPADARTKAAIIISSDIEPTATTAGKPLQEAAAGAALPVAVHLQRRANGSAASPVAVPAGARVTASLLLPNGQVKPLGALDAAALTSRRALPVALPADSAGRAAIRLGLAMSVTAGGVTTELAPRSVDVPFTVTPPAGQPQLPQTVTFGEIDSTQTGEGTLPVRGTGCVWLAGAPTIEAAPEGVGATVTATGGGAGQSDCVKAGPDAGLRLQLTPTQAGMGSVDGTLPIDFVDERGAKHSTTVRFEAQLTKPLNRSAFGLVFALALLLGVGIPIGLLYLVKWRATRIPSLPLAAQTIPVTVRDGQVLRDGVPLQARPGDLRDLVPIPSGGVRSLHVGPLDLRTVMGRSPLGSGDVHVEVPDQVVVTSHRPYPRRDAGFGVLPLAIHNTWVLAHDPAAAPDHAQLTLLLPGDATAAQRDALFADAGHRIPDMLHRIRPDQPDADSAYSLWATGAPTATSGSDTSPTHGTATRSERDQRPPDEFTLWDQQ